jgi:hypothetical protein
MYSLMKLFFIALGQQGPPKRTFFNEHVPKGDQY